MKAFSLGSIIPFTVCFPLVLLSSCLGASTLRQHQELQGKLQEGGNAPFSTLLLVTPTQKYWEITGPLQEELRSFIGMEVRLQGQESARGVLYPRFIAAQYEILSAGGEGERPLIGYVEEQQGKVLFRSPDMPTPLHLTGPLLPQLHLLVGKRIWVIGEREKETLEVKRFGVVR
jgi:hypothetical protein